MDSVAQMMAYNRQNRYRLAVGDSVETVGLSPEDSDTGLIVNVSPLTIAWDSGVTTPGVAADLRRV